MVSMEEPFVFNNIKEKSEEVVQLSGCSDCEKLQFNLYEYKQFVLNYGIENDCLIDLTFDNNCPASVDFRLMLLSTRTNLTSTYSVNCP